MGLRLYFLYPDRSRLVNCPQPTLPRTQHWAPRYYPQCQVGRSSAEPLPPLPLPLPLPPPPPPPLTCDPRLGPRYFLQRQVGCLQGDPLPLPPPACGPRLPNHADPVARCKHRATLYPLLESRACDSDSALACKARTDERTAAKRGELGEMEKNMSP